MIQKLSQSNYCIENDFSLDKVFGNVNWMLAHPMAQNLSHFMQSHLDACHTRHCLNLFSSGFWRTSIHHKLIKCSLVCNLCIAFVSFYAEANSFDFIGLLFKTFIQPLIIIIAVIANSLLLLCCFSTMIEEVNKRSWLYIVCTAQYSLYDLQMHTRIQTLDCHKITFLLEQTRPQVNA